MHDWGAVGLAFAQRRPERVERMVLINVVPFLPGYRWHRLARAWRTPVLGELAMGTMVGFTLKHLSREANVTPGPLPEDVRKSMVEYLDQGTERAILRLYRSSPPERLAAAGEHLGDVQAPTLVVWGARDPYIPERFAREYVQGAAPRPAAGATRRRPLAVARSPRPAPARARLPRRTMSGTAVGERVRGTPRERGVGGPVTRVRRAPGGRPAGPRPGVAAGGADGGHLPGARPLQSGPGGRQLSKRSVLARRLDAVGQLLVRRPPPAGVLAAGAGARRAHRAALAGGAGGGRPGGVLRTATGPRDARHPRPRGVAVVRVRRRLRVALEPRPLRPRAGDRAGGAAAGPPPPASGARAVPAVLARQPGGGGVPGAGAARVGDRGLAPAARAVDGAGGAGPDRPARVAVPGRRHPAVRAVGLLGSPGSGGAARADGRPRAAPAAHRRGPLRTAADRRLRGAERRGRKRRAPGSAARGAGGGAGAPAPPRRALRPPPAVAACGAGAVPGLLADQRAAGGLPRGPRPPVGRQPPSTPPCSASCGAWTSATAPARRGSRSCPRRPTGKPAGSPPT